MEGLTPEGKAWDVAALAPDLEKYIDSEQSFVISGRQPDAHFAS